MSLNKQIGERIRIARKHAGLTQQELGKKLVRSGAAIAYLEQGKRRVSPDMLSQIAEITERPMAYFYEPGGGNAAVLTDRLSELRYQLSEIKSVLDDTEKQKKVVEEKKKIYYHAFNRSLDGVCISDLKGDILDVNEALLNMLGYERGELVGQDVRFFCPAHDQMSDENLKKLMRSVPWSGEVDATRKNGEVFTVSLAVSLVTNLDKAPIGFMAVVQDITEQKKSERSIRQLQATIDHSHEGFSFWNEEGVCQYMNDAHAALLGYKTAKACLNKNIWDLFYGMSRNDYLEYRENLLKQKKHSSGEQTLTNAKGETTEVEISTTSLFEGDQYKGHICRAVDISERKKGEEILRNLVSVTSKSTCDSFYSMITRHLAAAFQVQYAFICRIADDMKKAEVVCMWDGLKYSESFTYDLKGTPCAEVVNKKVCLFADGLQEKFPEDEWLIEQGIESYLAIPLFTSSGNPLGHLGVMDTKPLRSPYQIESILEIFAVRVAGEMEVEEELNVTPSRSPA